MKPENDSKSGGKRISFLMPYIDFCFMLIIIFVGMLSIAYFDPVGLADFYARTDPEQNQVMGRYDVAPPGIERRNDGTGGDAMTGAAQPMVGKDYEGAMMYATPSPAPNQDVGTGTGDASQAELDALRRRMQQLLNENARLRSRAGAARAGAGTRTAPAQRPAAPRGAGTGAQGTTGAQQGAAPAPATNGSGPKTPPANTGPGISDHLYLDLRNGGAQ